MPYSSQSQDVSSNQATSGRQSPNDRPEESDVSPIDFIGAVRPLGVAGTLQYVLDHSMADASGRLR